MVNITLVEVEGCIITRKLAYNTCDDYCESKSNDASFDVDTAVYDLKEYFRLHLIGNIAPDHISFGKFVLARLEKWHNLPSTGKHSERLLEYESGEGKPYINLFLERLVDELPSE